MTTSKTIDTNDYAVARELNLRAMSMIMCVYLADYAGVAIKLDIQELNRTYILLVNELQKLYDKNPKLAAIEPEPVWKHLDVLKDRSGIIKHVAGPDGDNGGPHYARVEKLCILLNAGTPHFTAEQKKLYEYAEEVMDEYLEGVDEAFEQKAAKEISDTLDTQEDGGHIAKLSLAQKSLKLNIGGVTHTLKHFESTKRFNYNLARYLLNRPDQWVSKNDLASFRMRSEIKDWPKLIGFTGDLKDIFINVNTKEQTIMLNPNKSLTPNEAAILLRLVNKSKLE